MKVSSSLHRHRLSFDHPRCRSVLGNLGGGCSTNTTTGGWSGFRRPWRFVPIDADATAPTQWPQCSVHGAQQGRALAIQWMSAAWRWAFVLLSVFGVRPFILALDPIRTEPVPPAPTRHNLVFAFAESHYPQSYKLAGCRIFLRSQRVTRPGCNTAASPGDYPESVQRADQHPGAIADLPQPGFVALRAL